MMKLHKINNQGQPDSDKFKIDEEAEILINTLNSYKFVGV